MMLCVADAQGFCLHCGKLLPFANQDSLCGRSKPHGIGTHLKILLRRVFIKSYACCKCSQMARHMNKWSAAEARANIDKILEVMRLEANKRGLPFLDALARKLVNRAIANAEEEARRMQSSSG